MIKVYGSHFCPHCQECIRKYNAAGLQYEFHDISDGLLDLKQFLMLRDTEEEVFAEAKANGKVGIPVVVKDNGEVTNDWRSFVPADTKDGEDADSKAVIGAACNIDGTGC